MKNVLIVDENECNRKLLALNLRVYYPNVNVINSSNGIEAEKMYVNNKDSIDMLLTEVRLPGQNGIELAQRVRQYNKNIPIGFITAQPKEDIPKDFINSFYHRIPFDYDRLGVSLINYGKK